jgi:hypothetical protein
MEYGAGPVAPMMDMGIAGGPEKIPKKPTLPPIPKADDKRGWKKFRLARERLLEWERKWKLKLEAQQRAEAEARRQAELERQKAEQEAAAAAQGQQQAQPVQAVHTPMIGGQ